MKRFSTELEGLLDADSKKDISNEQAGRSEVDWFPVVNLMAGLLMAAMVYCLLAWLLIGGSWCDVEVGDPAALITASVVSRSPSFIGGRAFALRTDG